MEQDALLYYNFETGLSEMDDYAARALLSSAETLREKAEGKTADPKDGKADRHTLKGSPKTPPSDGKRPVSSDSSPKAKEKEMEKTDGFAQPKSDF